MMPRREPESVICLHIGGEWLYSGMSMGSAAAFMLTGPSTKITNLGALKIVLGAKRFLLYLAFVMLCSFAVGTKKRRLVRRRPMSRAESPVLIMHPGITPGTCVIQYTGHSEYTRNDPPTYSCVGTSDGIANWRTMKVRADEMSALGIPVEFHTYDGLPHGFGLGTGTVAEGWINDAAAFWEKQM